MSGISDMTEDMYSQAEITEYYTVGGRFMPTRRTASYIYIYTIYCAQSGWVSFEGFSSLSLDLCVQVELLLHIQDFFLKNN